ncbi:MAG TPA: hypothetical protein VFX30_11550 [bacterium]|nr:hypothetical protein [bacterium]
MKRFFPILLSLLALTACPQAGQVLAPGNFSATAPKSGNEDLRQEPPPPGPQVNDPMAPGSWGDGSTTGDQTVATGDMPVFYSGNRPLASADPIDPKSDHASIDHSRLVARLRYGKDFSTILPKSSPADYLLETPTAQVALRFRMDVTYSGTSAGWNPFMENDLPETPQVRVVYVPKGSSPSEAQYADAVWEVTDNGEILYKFPQLSIGEGDLIFSMDYLDESSTVVGEKTSDYHSGNLIPLGTGDTSKPFPHGEGRVYKLGSFQIKPAP